ncbi:hypothetical protein GCM10009843_33710 [Nocardioides bigeumensis]|uniref:Aquaporin Z n=2 Tax=Nocardioides bigeumensis TaxID=433657 RepID=A0ABP5KDP9_9ACTN
MGGDVLWGQWPVYVAAEPLAGVAAAVLFGIIAHTAQDVAATASVAAAPSEV